jgi:carboxyl-terminal processing protease
VHIEENHLNPQANARNSTGRFGTKWKHIVLGLVLIATFGAGAGAERVGIIGGGDAGASSSMMDQPAFQAFQQTWDLIQSDYVDESAIVDEKLIYGAAAGMVAALGDDGHSRFVPKDEAEAYYEALKGELVGIGVQIDMSSGRPVIVAALDGSPAAEAGVEGDDVLVEVDGQTTDRMSQLDLFQLLRGDEGTTVEITLERPREDRTYTVSLVRSRISIEPVTWTMLPSQVALVRIAQFSENTTDRLREALTDARGQGATAIVLDLRDNPGGYTNEAVGVAGQFLPDGTTVFNVEDREGRIEAKRTEGEGLALDMPLVVLINGGSASAAEIVASALRDNDRALLVGETTYGTGTQLLPMELSDGSLLVLGTSLWLTADGEQVWHTGIEPAIEVELSAGGDQVRPGALNLTSQSALAAAGDVQLQRAFETLTQ